MTERLFCLYQTAAQLSIPASLLNRWHHANWLPATTYEVVSVPRVGPKGARRWSQADIDQALEHREQLCAWEESLRKLRRAYRDYGRAVAIALLEGHPDPVPPSAPKHICNAAIDHSEVPICAKAASEGFLKQAHGWAIARLKREFQIDVAGCILHVSWRFPTARESWSFYDFYPSYAQRHGDTYFISISGGTLLEFLKDVDELQAPIRTTREYRFLDGDPEIGRFLEQTEFQNLLRAYFHEISHVASCWLEKTGQALPTDLLQFEAAVRRGTPEERAKQDETGHGLAWSAIYRSLVRGSARILEKSTARAPKLQSRAEELERIIRELFA